MTNFYYLKIEKTHKKEASEILYEAYRGLRYAWEGNRLIIETTFQIIDEVLFTLGDNGVEILSQKQDCPECEATGRVEEDERQHCGKAPSVCCGACYVEILCPECEGEKIIDFEL